MEVKQLTHGSLFSGIGGFDLAAERCGIKNIFQVEINKFCQKVLNKNFPDVKKYYDIKEFSGQEYKKRIDIISGGFPCQPFSIAGRREGQGDNRHLFPEMLRVISEIEPTWVIAENVYGLLSIERGLVFEGVCSSLDNLGYEVQTFIIPAIGKNAPHRRNRLWIIANSRCKHGQGSPNKREFKGKIDQKNAPKFKRPTGYDRIRAFTDGERELQQKRVKQDIGGWFSNENNIIYPYSSDEQWNGQCKEKTESRPLGLRHRGATGWEANWYEVATRLCRVDDGLPRGMDRNKGSRLKAIGNAIVPQIAEEIFKAILSTTERDK